jgi:hypothetical protein
MRSALAIPLLALAIVGCSGEPSETHVDPGPDPKPKPSIEALYGPAAETRLTPYPSDRYTVADPSTGTGLRVRVDGKTTGDPLIGTYDLVASELAEMDGFSTSGGVIVSFSGPIDLRGIIHDPDGDPPVPEPAKDAYDFAEKGSPLLLVDVDPKSPERGKARGIVPKWWEQAKDGYYLTDEFTLIAQPATPLLPGTRYLFVVTSALKARDGGEIGRSPDSEALLSGKTQDAYGAEMAAALDELETSIGVSRDDVVLGTVFTTAHVLDETLAVAKRARTEPVPALVEPWTVETPTSPPDTRVRFRAVYEAPEYRRPLPQGTWQIEGGVPVVQKKVGLEVFLAFSDASKSGPRPVVIYQHGLGGDKDGCWGTSQRLAELGAAVIAIDSPDHGSRSTGGTALTAAYSFFGVDPDAQTFDIARARDNFRQMTSDQLELVRFIGSLGSLDLLPVGAPDGVPDLDVSRILYIGHSFGSVQGPAIFALAPEIKQATWNVGGDGLMNLLRDSGTFSLLVNSLRPPATPDGAIGRFFAVTQAIVDPGDPINFARFASIAKTPGVADWAPRDVLLQEVLDDTIVPNSTSEALARAAGLALVDPIRPVSGLPEAAAPVTGNVAGGATGALVQFDFIEGGQLAQHGELIFSPEAMGQYVEFFKTGLASGHGTVMAAYPPGPHK